MNAVKDDWIDSVNNGMNQLFIKRIAYDHSIDTHQSDATQGVYADHDFGAKSNAQFTTLVAQCLVLIMKPVGYRWNLRLTRYLAPVDALIVAYFM